MNWMCLTVMRDADWALGRLLGAREVTFRTPRTLPIQNVGGYDPPNPSRIDAYGDMVTVAHELLSRLFGLV